MPLALIAIGSNRGDRPSNCTRAVELLASHESIRALRVSHWHETAPAGGSPGQSSYLNGAALLETSLSPHELLQWLHDVEQQLGRERHERWGPRTIDLDLLLYDEQVVRTADLIVPHPRMAFRRFVLEPAAEIAPSMRHPTMGWSVERLLQHLTTSPPIVAISTCDLEQTSQIAESVAAACGWHALVFSDRPSNRDDATASPSFAGPLAVKFLGELAKGRPTSGGVVSPVWVEDARSLASVRWPEPIEAVLRPVNSLLANPRLLAVFDKPPPAVSLLPSDAIAEWNRANAARKASVARQSVAPVLWLDEDETLTAEQQLIAAIQAM